MALIHAIRTGNEQLVKCALYCGAKINNIDYSFENTLFQAMSFNANNKFSPKIIKILLDNGAKMSKHYRTLSRAIEFTNYCMEAHVIKFKSNSEKEKVNQIFQIIDLVIDHEIPNKLYMFDETWCHSIWLARNCINNLENDSHTFVFRLFDELIRLGIKPDHDTLSAFIELLILGIDNKKKVSDELIFKLLDRLICMGAKPNEESNGSNTLGLAIQTKNIKIIRIIASIVSGPDRSDTEFNSLNLAVKTLDREIIEEIIMIGGRPSNGPNSYTFTISAKAILDRDIFNTLICMGAMIPADLLKAMHCRSVSLCNFYNYFGRSPDNDLPEFNFNKIDANELKIIERIEDISDHCSFYDFWYIGSKFEQPMIQRIQNNMNRLVNKYSERFFKKSDLEKTLTSLPVCLNGITHEYYYNQTIIVINWIKIFDDLDANFDNMSRTHTLFKRLIRILTSLFRTVQKS